MNNTEFSHNLEQWFQERPKWVQEAAYRLINTGNLTEKDYLDLLSICLKEAVGETVTYSRVESSVFNVQESSVHLRLESVSDVKGINALCPTKPLEFTKSQLCIVYGRNGSGKSGYVRLLKNACGTRYSGELLQNIFDSSDQPQSANLIFTTDGQTKSMKWSGNSLKELFGIDIYDTEGGLIYVNEENEITFEPWLLQFFTQLTRLCENLKQRINLQIASLPSHKPTFPSEFATTNASKWYNDITSSYTQGDIDIWTRWEPKDEAELIDTKKRLSEVNPLAKARTIRHQRNILNQLISHLDFSYKGLTDEVCSDYLMAKSDANIKRNAADQDAKLVFQKAPIKGIGSESWKLLWDAARKFSEGIAYPSEKFPNIGDDAVCVLCQRELTNESRDRFTSFESFVKNELQSQVTKAEQILQTKITRLPNIITLEEVNLRLDGIGITDEDTRKRVIAFNENLLICKQKLIEANFIAEVPDLPPISIMEHLKKVSDDFEKLAIKYDEDGKGRSRLEIILKDISARKWLNQQSLAIKEEISRLIEVQKLRSAEELTNTTGLTKKKSILTESLITLPYIERFRKELKDLKAESIQVEIKKSRAELGRVFHRIVLQDAVKSVRTSDILSEGEFRIVSLAAFLADTEGRGSVTTFIFDDPISSLDQVYEEAAAQRLVELSKERQVIVFTHRLSLVGLLDKYSRKEGVEKTIITLSRSRIGDITDQPINLSTTKPTAKRYLNERLAKAKKAFHISQAEYEVMAKALCGDIRILLEQIVELDMLAGIVRRYNPEVQTKGKIERLAKIKTEDCKFIDDLMTAYSRYEHSQPDEAPVDLPNPDELEIDLKAIVAFIESMDKR